MKKSIIVNKKKRGRPATGQGTLVGVRLLEEPLSKIEAWAARQEDNPGRPEAIRRLVEIGLKAKS